MLDMKCDFAMNWLMTLYDLGDVKEIKGLFKKGGN